MAAPTDKTNADKILDALEWHLTRITYENGYRTPGLVVDRDRDPTMARVNKPELYRQLNAAVQISPGEATPDAARSMSGFQRYDWVIWLKFLRTLDRTQHALAGKTLDQLVTDTWSDIGRMCKRDAGLKTAAAALHAEKPTMGFQPGAFSCVEVKVGQLATNPDKDTWPDVLFAIALLVKFDEYVG